MHSLGYIRSTVNGLKDEPAEYFLKKFTVIVPLQAPPRYSRMGYGVQIQNCPATLYTRQGLCAIS